MIDDDIIIREAPDDVLSRPGEQQAEQRREEAFHASYSWRGQSSEGLSCSKKMLCDALCFKAGFPPLKAGFDDLQWFAPMAKAIVFVCATDAKRLRRLWGLGIDTVMESFTEWVDANVSLREEQAILQLGQQILIDSTENQAEALPTAGASGK